MYKSTKRYPEKLSILFILLMLLIIVIIFPYGEILGQEKLEYKVGILGAPDHPSVEWSDSTLEKMKQLGFNTLQLNIAWGSRPNDEPLNLEDVVEVPKHYQLPIDKMLNKTLHSPQRIKMRSERIWQRIIMCKKYGFRSIFQFGAPFAGHPRHEKEPLPQSISDTTTVNRYITLVKEFHKKFPGVNDIMMYTYDQDAWLGSEFGPCPKCHGVAVSKRVAGFVNTIAQEWRQMNSNGFLWWEPWELSAGEVYAAIPLLDSSCVGLTIHSNIAEVQIAFPAGRWFKNVLYIAKVKNIPVIAEVWTGCPTEEMEPYTHIPTPLLTLQELRDVYTAGYLAGIKEYYGNVPNVEDPNLRMTGIFFHDISISDSVAMTELSRPYLNAANGVRKFWELSSEAVAFYPWDVSWHAREVGRSNPIHLMTAATLRGASWETPSWQSSRRTHFMRTDETGEPNFWEREDMQLRFQESASLMIKAISIADSIINHVPQTLELEFKESVNELKEFKRLALAYTYHLRETNLADDIRSSIKLGMPENQRLKNVSELKEILIKDQANEGVDQPIGAALDLLNKNLNLFLNTYFLPSKPRDSKGEWSITSN
jgi:hypothetical protein